MIFNVESGSRANIACQRSRYCTRSRPSECHWNPGGGGGRGGGADFCGVGCEGVRCECCGCGRGMIVGGKERRVAKSSALRVGRMTKEAKL